MMDIWFRKRDDYESVLTSKTDFSESKDETIEDLNYRFTVSKEIGCLEDMQRYAKKMFLLFRATEKVSEVLESKMEDVLVSLARANKGEFANRLLDTLCKNYALHYFVYNMRRVIRGAGMSVKSKSR